MIRCALADTFRPLTSTRRRRRASISSVSTSGSTTTPLPIAQILPGCRIPDGIRWNLNSSPSRTIVWPALLPPWKRTIVGARSARRSTTFPLPSPPHWAPTITTPGMPRRIVTVCPGGGAAASVAGAGLEPVVGAEEGERVAADLDQAGDGAATDLLLELALALVDVAAGVARDQHRPLV